jgi:hypothetical protein
MLNVGFTKESASYFLCQKELLLSLGNDKLSESIKQEYDQFNKSNSFKQFYKNIVRSIDDALRDNQDSSVADIIGRYLPGTKIFIGQTMGSILPKFTPHIFVACPLISFNDDIDIQKSHVLVFSTSTLEQQFSWIDKCIIKYDEDRKPFITCSKSEHCELLIPGGPCVKECLNKKEIALCLAKFGAKYPSICVLRPSDILIILRFLSQNWNYLKERIQPEMETEELLSKNNQEVLKQMVTSKR